MTVQQLADTTLAPSLEGLVKDAKELYQRHYSNDNKEQAYVTVAPGRVNLIGEHVDYTGGFVLPLAIDYCTVVYGTGKLVVQDGETEDDSVVAVSSTCNIVSTKSSSNKETCTITLDSKPPPTHTGNWTNYVMGVVAQYLPDIPSDSKYGLELSMAISGDVPLGSGLSSSASLEVAVATFVEHVLGSTLAYSSAKVGQDQYAKIRALRCQKAENVWCHSPCGIMDQYVSSAASKGALLLIDCTSFEFEKVYMKEDTTEDKPVLVVTNSNVCHDIAGGEYPVRVAQCKTATLTLQEMFGADKIPSLRYATLEQVEQAKSKFPDDVSYKRAKHVVTENERTLQCQQALQEGDWIKVGHFMNGSHASMKDDYEVSCTEIDVLVELAQSYTGGVYGSRLTGGGFGGCTVTLVKQSCAKGLMDYLKEQYKLKTNKECDCFETTAGDGARLVAMDG